MNNVETEVSTLAMWFF